MDSIYLIQKDEKYFKKILVSMSFAMKLHYLREENVEHLDHGKILPPLFQKPFLWAVHCNYDGMSCISILNPELNDM